MDEDEDEDDEDEELLIARKAAMSGALAEDKWLLSQDLSLEEKLAWRKKQLKRLEVRYF